MSTLYKVLGALAFVVLVIFTCVAYVWYRIAFMPELIPAQTGDTFVEVPEVVATSTKVDVTPTTNATSTPVEQPVRVNPDLLTPEQKALLETFGVDTANLVITPHMRVCAIGSVGEVRLREIEKGATPTVAEGLNLLVCYKK